jgi:hypothetical protein
MMQRDLVLNDWTIRNVINLASGTNDMVAARSLQLSSHWHSIAHDGYMIWAQYHENERKKYEIRIDMIALQAEGKGFTCTCSRNRPPCEHILSLLLIILEAPEKYLVDVTPDAIMEKMDRRSRRVRSRLEGLAQPPKLSPDEQTDSSNQFDQSRFEQMQDGIAELDHWMRNLMRQGLGHVNVTDPAFWQPITDRMVDSFLPGIADRLRYIAQIPQMHLDEWVEPLLAELGKLYLLVDSFKRYHALPLPVQADMRDAVGWSFKTLPSDAEIDTVHDQWVVLGKRDFKYSRNSWLRRTWLYGQQSERYAVVKEYVIDPALLMMTVTGGQQIEATLRFFPSRAALRAQLDSPVEQLASADLTLPLQTMEEALARYQRLCARNPWLTEAVVCVDDMIPFQYQERWYAKSGTEEVLPLHPNFRNHWPLMAMSGGYPLQVLGEWDGRFFFPLVVVTDRYVDINDSSLT